MKPIVFNYAQSNLSFATTSVMLRFAYVFAGYATSMGDTGEGMAYDQNIERCSVKDKIAYLDGMWAKEDNNEVKDFLKQAAWAIKSYTSLKYKTPQQLITFKKFQQSLHEMFMLQVNAVTDYMRQTGIAELSKLVDGKSFGFFGIGSDNPEEKSNEHYCTASEILTDGYTAEAHDEEKCDEAPDYANVFFLPPQFFDEAFAKQYTLVSAYSVEAENPGNVYLEEMFSLPDINAFTAQELKKTKAQLSAFAETFTTAGVSFFEQCYKNESPATRIAAFIKTVLPAAETYRLHLQQNEMLQLSRRVHLNDVPAVIAMGEIPVTLLWKFYRYMNLLRDATWAKLEPLMQHENFTNCRLPFLAIKKPSFLDEGVYTQQDAAQPLPAVKKKFICVD